ncbi:NACHT domain-containing protein [Streptomyces prasinus]|uniref:NACHT domain-containing protein n=1 Tax=Streptomyces prasinus TaxID=67345 RepID=UPI0033EDA25F
MRASGRTARGWRAAAVGCAVLVCVAGYGLFRSLPAGDVDPFGALTGALGALAGGAGLVVSARQYQRERRTGAKSTLARAVRTHEDRQYRNLLGPRKASVPVRFHLSAPPGGPEDSATATHEWPEITDRFLALPGPARRLAILGGPGSGKSLLAKELTLALASRQEENVREVPVLLSLSSWTGFPLYEKPENEAFHTAFRDWLVHETSRTYGQPPALVTDVLDGAPADVVLVLDGLDELDPGGDAGTPLARPRARALLRYLADNPACPGDVVLTCRTTVYEEFGGTAPLAGGARAELLPVPPDAALAHLRARSAWADHGRTERWDAVLEEIRTAPSSPVARQLLTPWRLTMTANAYHVRSEDGGHWHRDPAELVTRWGREALLDRYHREVVESGGPHRSPQASWDLLTPGERLRDAEASPVAEDMSGEAEEYLLSLYVPSVVAGHPVRRHRYPADRVARWLTLLATHRQRDDLTAPPTPGDLAEHRASLAPHQLWPLGGRRLVRTLHGSIATLIALAVTGLLVFTVHAPGDVLLGFPLIVSSVIAAVLAWSDRPDIDPSSRVGRTGRTLGIPDRTIIAVSLASAGVVWGGLYGMVVAGSVVEARPPDLPPIVWAATAAGALLGVPLLRNWSVETYTTVKGAAPGLRHRIFLVCAALRGRLPLRLGRFLDWAHQGGLLRVDGSAYRFRHDEFEQYLWRAHRRPRVLAVCLAAAESAYRAGTEVTEVTEVTEDTDGQAAADRMLTGVATLAEHRPDLSAACPAGTVAAAEETSEALRTWAAQLASGATGSRLVSHRDRATHALRRFRASAERRA